MTWPDLSARLLSPRPLGAQSHRRRGHRNPNNRCASFFRNETGGAATGGGAVGGCTGSGIGACTIWRTFIVRTYALPKLFSMIFIAAGALLKVCAVAWW